VTDQEQAAQSPELETGRQGLSHLEFSDYNWCNLCTRDVSCGIHSNRSNCYKK